MENAIKVVAALSLVGAGICACSDRSEAQPPQPRATVAQTVAAPTAPALPGAATSPAAFITPQVADWSGRYEGDFDGGSGEITIARDGTRYVAEIGVYGDGGCVGGTRGTGEVRGGSFVFQSVYEDYEGVQQTCEVTLTPEGRRFTTRPQNCSYFHGASCDFTGSVEKVSQ